MTTQEEELNTSLQNRIFQSEIDKELIKHLYAGSKFRPCLHFVSLLIVVSILYGNVPNNYIIGWALTLATLNIFRFLDISHTQRLLNEISNYKQLKNRFSTSAILLGLTYGLGIAYVFPDLSQTSQLYILCLVTTLVPAGIVSFASDKQTFFGYFYSLCLPIVAQLLLMLSVPHLNIAICSLIFVAISHKLFIWNYDFLIYATELRLTNDMLVVSLQESNTRLQQQNIKDDLTGIANRRHLDDVLEKEWLRAKRGRTSLAMLMIDIDNFKQFNDTFGHLNGDECLIKVANTIENNLFRSGDFAARFGGEEFCVLMPETDLEGAIASAEKISSNILELKIENPSSEVSKYLTISIGVAAVIPSNDESHMDLIYTSDKALYKAKQDGRNIIRSMETLKKNPKPKLVV